MVNFTLARILAQSKCFVGVLSALCGHTSLATRRNSVEQWNWGGRREEGRRRGSEGSPPQRERQQGDGECNNGVYSDSEVQLIN